MHTNHDIDFQQECLAWLMDYRGAEYVGELEQLIFDHGSDEAIRQTLHPNMPDETRECYIAAIHHLSNLLAPQVS